MKEETQRKITTVIISPIIIFPFALFYGAWGLNIFSIALGALFGYTGFLCLKLLWK